MSNYLHEKISEELILRTVKDGEIDTLKLDTVIVNIKRDYAKDAILEVVTTINNLLDDGKINEKSHEELLKFILRSQPHVILAMLTKENPEIFRGIDNRGDNSSILSGIQESGDKTLPGKGEIQNLKMPEPIIHENLFKEQEGTILNGPLNLKDLIKGK